MGIVLTTLSYVSEIFQKREGKTSSLLYKHTLILHLQEPLFVKLSLLFSDPQCPKDGERPLRLAD